MLLFERPAQPRIPHRHVARRRGKQERPRHDALAPTFIVDPVPLMCAEGPPKAQRLRAEQATDAWKADYRVRPRVEHKISELVHHGIRQARYIGRVKTELQLLFTAAVVNVKRLGKLCQGGTLPIPA